MREYRRTIDEYATIENGGWSEGDGAANWAREQKPFPKVEIAPEAWMCDEGMALWASFAQVRPEDGEFIRPADRPACDTFANQVLGASDAGPAIKTR